MMEALCPSEMSSYLWTTLCYNSEDDILHSHCCENLKYRDKIISFIVCFQDIALLSVHEDKQNIDDNSDHVDLVVYMLHKTKYWQHWIQIKNHEYLNPWFARVFCI
jgi:hypothetical protein